MQIVSSIAAMQRLAKKWQNSGMRIGFVPTMGYLHAGHLSLVKRARQAVGKSGKVVVSIYVNPTQFAPMEDLSKYPRDLKRDLKLCREAGVDVVFAPGDAEMYSGGSGTGIFREFTAQTPARCLCHYHSALTSLKRNCHARWKVRRGPRIFAA